MLICAVYAMSELSDKIPQIYLRLVPVFFRLLTNSYNNSMINKVVKLLGILEQEYRLVHKLLHPLVSNGSIK